MKSKKIIAMIVAFAAFMAVATSGLAAVNTTTTYNIVTDKVTVKVAVTEATPGSEVTYLVTDSDGAGAGILYIDQKTATDGSVSFDYKIDKDKITDLYTNVKFGTNGDVPATEAGFVNSDANIELDALSASATKATVTYHTDVTCTSANQIKGIVGDGDTVYAKVVADEGFTVTSVKIDGDEKYDGSTLIFEIVGNQSIAVETEVQKVAVKEETVVSSDGIIFDTTDGDDDLSDIDEAVAEGKTVSTTLIKVTAKPNEVGVKIGEKEYPAYTSIVDGVGQKDYQSGQIYAVRVITDSAVTIEAYAR